MKYDELHNIDSPIFHGGSNPHIPEFNPSKVEVSKTGTDLIGTVDTPEPSNAEVHMGLFRPPNADAVWHGEKPKFQFEPTAFEKPLEKAVKI